ncbi:hypothetical protein [Bradyrhizobium genosp. L]|uniref:hypothetical protein n=1 Tax=Bradyrhizobium genosp. L TaxID=83637 RepID=UPI001FEEBE69|nr:hypothetical protein [Bradyrhizobium genosp. L]
MNWFYWNTAWSLFFSFVCFMTITRHPEAQIADAGLRDEAFGGGKGAGREVADTRRADVMPASSERSHRAGGTWRARPVGGS